MFAITSELFLNITDPVSSIFASTTGVTFVKYIKKNLRLLGDHIVSPNSCLQIFSPWLSLLKVNHGVKIAQTWQGLNGTHRRYLQSFLAAYGKIACTQDGKLRTHGLSFRQILPVEGLKGFRGRWEICLIRECNGGELHLPPCKPCIKCLCISTRTFHKK